MEFLRLVFGWLGVTGVLLFWRECERRLRGEPGPMGAALRVAAPPLMIEAGLLSLLGGLWFATLGSGGAWLVFGLVGALMEIPPRLRQPRETTPVWKPAVGRITRILLAGLVLGFVMD